MREYMTVSFRLDTRITKKEQRFLFGWGTDIYEDEHYNLEWRPRMWHLFAYVDEQLVSHAGMLKHEILVGDTPVWVGGLGQLVTVPTSQRQGYAAQTLDHAIGFLRNEIQVPFALLFCIERMILYYARRGWQLLEVPVVIEQPTGKIESPMPVMVLPLRKQPWPPGVVDLRSLPW
jgi:GNAT superfamily N-acetyltransferase